MKNIFRNIFKRHHISHNFSQIKQLKDSTKEYPEWYVPNDHFIINIYNVKLISNKYWHF